MSGLMPPNILSYEGQVVVPFINKPFPPTPQFFNFNVPTIWIDTVTQAAWILVAKPQNVANWIPFAAGMGDVMTLTGNSGGAVPPTAGTINVVGDNINFTTVGNPATSTLLLEPLGTIPIQFDENSGMAVPAAGILNVLGTNGITTTGGGNTITISPTNGSLVAGNTVDANTVPGTNPVVPNGSGLIIVTGGQVAAGKTANVIRTDSLAANTYTIEIQRSQAVDSSTIGDNGVSHFNSAQFTVDGNGFVSIVGGLGFSSIKNQVFTGSGTYTPTSGMAYCQIICLGGGGAGGGATATSGTTLCGAAGGGAGEYAVGIFSAATIGVSQTVTIGAGGAGSSGATGGAGGTTSVGILITSGGGAGGGTYSASSSTGSAAGGLGGTGGSGGDYRSPGYNGFESWSSTTSVTVGFVYSSQGADSQLGRGGRGVFLGNSGSGNGEGAGGYGAGGAGGINSFSNSATNGGAGSLELS